MATIVIVSAVFPPEPIVSAMLSHDIAEKLSNKGYEVVVLCPKPTRPHGFQFTNTEIGGSKFSIIHLDSYTHADSSVIGRFRESYSFGRKCVAYIKKKKDIVCLYINTWPLLAQYLTVRVAVKHKIYNIVHVQDIYPESLINKLLIGKNIFYKLLLPIDKYVLTKSSAVIAISENMSQTLSETRRISPDKISVIQNWQNEDDFINYRNTRKTGILEDKASFTFMYMGNIGPVAGVDLLIKSFVKAEITDARLVIAGSGSALKACTDLVNSIGVNNIEFIPVPQGAVPETQDKADVLLLPVKKNGALSSIPSKLPAYMFSAKPIIGSLDIKSDTASAIKKADAGIVVEPENEEALAKAMLEISQWSKQTLKNKGENGFNYALSHLSRANNLEKIVSLIESYANKEDSQE